mmetsp:Transcript_20436/g.53196  ORF Transcript_20436/g.53196 Transcript_20436/m.53196 type:complete len:272 (-) Transcript_20436:35-850(-)
MLEGVNALPCHGAPLEDVDGPVNVGNLLVRVRQGPFKHGARLLHQRRLRVVRLGHLRKAHLLPVEYGSDNLEPPVEVRPLRSALAAPVLKQLVRTRGVLDVAEVLGRLFGHFGHKYHLDARAIRRWAHQLARLRQHKCHNKEGGDLGIRRHHCWHREVHQRTHRADNRIALVPVERNLPEHCRERRGLLPVLFVVGAHPQIEILSRAFIPPRQPLPPPVVIIDEMTASFPSLQERLLQKVRLCSGICPCRSRLQGCWVNLFDWRSRRGRLW